MGAESLHFDPCPKAFRRCQAFQSTRVPGRRGREHIEKTDIYPWARTQQCAAAIAGARF